MNFDIDIAIVSAFLLLTLFVGLGHGQKVRSIKDYALGDRKFSTAALVATIVATYASGSGFFVTISRTYSDGFYHLFATSGIAISFFITSFILVPRMGEFLGKVSIADAMGDLYGNKVRFVTAIAATIGSSGLIAVQFKVFGGVFSYFLPVSSNIAIVVAGLITTIYSAFGGVRSVTFTDVLQFFAFGAIIPLLGFITWNHYYYSESHYNLLATMANSKFNLSSLFDTSNTKFVDFIALLVYFAIPTVSAPKFQRIAMGSSIEQVKKAFIISGLILVAIKFFVAWIPFLVYNINPNLQADQILIYIVDTFTFTGLKGFVLVAIIAFAMSTADSRINASSVLFTHDIYGVIQKHNKNEILISRIASCILGIITVSLSLIETDLLNTIIFANSFYHPLIIPPFFLTLFGFRSSSKSVLVGMCAGLLATTLWKFLPVQYSSTAWKVIGLLWAILCNAIFLIGSHYILKQPGGWVQTNNKSYFDKKSAEKQNEKVCCYKKIKEFSILNFCRRVAPRDDITYTTLGVYFIICTIATMYSTQVELLGPNAQLIQIIYPLMLITGTVMAMYPLWPLSILTSIKRRLIEMWYPAAIFYMLIFFSSFFVLVSKFTTLQVLLFGVNILIASLLLGWRLALSFILIGFYLSIKFYYCFFKGPDFVMKFGSPEFILIYMVLFLGLIVLIFIKPKQEEQEIVEAKVDTLEGELEGLDDIILNLKKQEGEYTKQIADLNQAVTHYSERVTDQAKEIERLGATAQKILNNVNHELRLPVGNVMNFSQMICEG
ncbi:MAG TPA: hypothetical protein QKA08_01365, partial [Candidatus Megaira endosymbiont of Nemacystus decipiens]|nr:hypothetical protein [Candidatus Megaera endosymbiont of Nemacystus decipiens]